MNQPITMPALSDTMNNGRLVRWTKRIGDPIKRGDSVADVETDKAVMDVEAFHDGYLAGPLAAEGSEMPVGATMGYIAESLDATSAPSAASEPSATVPSMPGAAAPVQLDAPPPGPTALSAARPSPPAVARVRASPYARRLAQQMGVDVKQVMAQPDGVHAEAVLNAARRTTRPAANAGPPYRLERASSAREALARNMTAGLATPTFHMTARLTLAPLLAVSKDTDMSLTLLLARACALTVKAHSLFNSVYTPEGCAFRERVDVAIAVDTLQGPVAPVIRDAAGRSLEQLAVDWRNLHEKALGCGLSVEDCQGATFYLSNLGMYSVVHSFDAVLPVGAVAVLCVAAADGDRTSFTLGCDHRVVAGADAARFLKTLAEFLASPDRLTETRGCVNGTSPP
jgi:pyruvate dehydrogenase E2 component (dihydrolipoamide acetyltransferase)